jgi:DNA-binding CsgD family transcriptional regulator
MTATDVRLLALVEDVIGLTDLNEFRLGLLDALGRAVPSDVVSLNDLGPGPTDAFVIAIPPPEPGLLDVFARLQHQNPLAAYHARTRDGRAIRFSDVVSRRELHQLPLYREIYAQLGVEYQIAFTLPAGPNRMLGVALSRGDHNFTNAERDLLNRARPVVIQAFRNAIEHDALRSTIAGLREGRAVIAALLRAGLTEREAQIVNALAHGQSVRDIAARLEIGYPTVRKHLERCFAKLGVSTQSSAAARAWALADLQESTPAIV